MTPVKAIPDGYPQVTPYLCVDGAAEAIDLYAEIFGAKERMRMAEPDGRIGHAEIAIGDAVIMLADEHADIGFVNPHRLGGTAVVLSVYVEDVDATYDRAVRAGAKALRPVENQFYGDRTGQFEDPYGHRWSVATHVEDVPPEEMERRAHQRGA